MQRQTDKGLPQYNDADTFLDWTGEELVHTSEGYYRCENEGLFARFQRTNGFWIATLRDGTRFVFGQSSQARLERVPGETCCWQLELSEDLNGNRVAYRYTNHLNQLYPREIEYGLHATEPSGTYRVVLDYSEDRPDPIVDYRPRFRCETRWRLTGVTVFHQQRRIRHWRFAYQTNSPVSLPASVTMFGDDRSQLGPSAKVNVDFLPPTTFDYTEARLGESWRMMTNQLNFDLHFTTGDAEFVDLNRDGLPDLIFELNGELLSALNHGPSRPWGEVKPVAGATVGTRLRQASTRLVDLSGDGAVKYLAQLPGDTAYFYRAFRSPTRLDDPVTFEIDGNLRLGSADVQFVDINHDKAIDLIFTADDGPAFLINQAKSSQAGRAARLFVPPRDPTMVGVRFSAGWQLADMNGDRLLDLVFIGTVEEGGTQVRLSRGWGEFEPAFTMTGDPRERAGDLGPRGKGGLSLVDINQDGLSDLVLVESGVVKVWLNQAGTAWAPPIVIDDSNLLPSQRRIPEFDANTTTVRFADLNGSGSVDIVWHQQGRAELVALDFSAQAKPYQFKRVTTGMGRGLEIAYKSSTEDMLAALGSTNAWTVVPPFAVQVVAATEETDGLGGRYRTELTYRNGYYDGYEKEFRGFEVARRREVGNDAQGAPALVTEFHFDTGATVEALKGKPLLVEARTESDAVFHREANDWITRRLPIQQAAGESRFVTFPFRQRQTTQLVELGPEDRSVTLLQEFQFDDYGNEILMADYGRVEGTNRLAWGDERIKTRRFSAEFPSGQQLWLLDQLVEEEIRNGTNRLAYRKQFFYDDEAFAGSNLGFVSKGNLTMVREWIDPNQPNSFRATVRNAYDAFGNRRIIYDPLATPGRLDLGHTVALEYDSLFHTHPIAETNYTANPDAKARGEAVPSLTIRVAYDLPLGVITNSIDFNTNVTTYLNDTFGRLTGVIKPGDSFNFPTAQFGYELRHDLPAGGQINWVETRLRETAGQPGTFDSRNFFDGFGRKVMTRSESENPGQVVVTGATLYNARRLPWKSLLPYFENGSLEYASASAAAGFHETRYDALGRETSVIQPATAPDGYRAFNRTTYEPLARKTEDEEQTKRGSIRVGAAMRYIEDGLRNQNGKGRLREVHEIVKLDDEGRSTATPQTWITRYRYDLLDNFLGYIDSQDNGKEFRYDSLSRKIYMNDPDRGVMTWEYDDASNLRETVDAKAQRITYTYDGVNRLLTEDYRDGAVGADVRRLTSESVVSNQRSVISQSLLTSAPTGDGVDVNYHYDAPYPKVSVGDGTFLTATNTKGMLAWVEDLSGEEHTSYDKRGRVEYVIKRIPDPQFLSYPLPSDGRGAGGEGLLVFYRTAFAYDSLDRITTLTYPDNDQVSYRYNARNLLQRITGGPSGSIISNIVYRPSDQLRQIDYGNGVRTTYDHDPRLRLSRLNTLAPRRGERRGEGCRIFHRWRSHLLLRPHRQHARTSIQHPAFRERFERH